VRASAGVGVDDARAGVGVRERCARDVGRSIDFNAASRRARELFRRSTTENGRW
jgi:hypothetical protein